MSTGRPDSSGLRLVADIGGTNARFALYRGHDLQHERVLACADYPDLVSAVESYLAQVHGDRPVEAAMAIAGPLHGDVVRMTNHVWEFSAAQTRRSLGLHRLILLNDFTALAMAVRHLPAAELEQIGGSQGVKGAPLALLGPGTGLGVSGLVNAGEHWVPLQGEGGHVTLAAASDREAAVLAELRRRFEHVSAERVLSGPGLVNLHAAVCAVDARPAGELTPADITQRGLSGECAACAETLSLFCAMLGTVASDLVLTLGAVGGLFIGGGIVTRLGAFFARSGFRERFEDKGRYKAYLSPVPAYVIHTARPAFVGLVQAFSQPGPRIEAG